jgi:lipopolysaccharide biosynthesis regulator YciM
MIDENESEAVIASQRAKEAYDRAVDLLNRGELDAAIVQLQDAAEADPHYKTLERLGEAWLNKGQPKRALVPLAAATTLNQGVRAPSILAEVLLTLGEPIAAHRIAKLALERHSTNRKARRVYDATLEAYREWSGE